MLSELKKINHEQKDNINTDGILKQLSRNFEIEEYNN